MKLIIWTILIFFFSTVCLAQTNTSTLTKVSKIDSFTILLKSDGLDSNRVNHLNKLSEAYWRTGIYDSASLFANRAVKLSTEIDNKTKQSQIQIAAKKGATNANLNLGSINFMQGNYDIALNYYWKALKIAEAIGNKNSIAVSFANIGNIYKAQSDYPNALENYLSALKIGEGINKKLLANTFGNIGSVYHIQTDHPKALEYYFKALNMAEELGDRNGIAMWVSNIGVVYMDQKNYVKALEYYFKGLKMAEDAGDKRLQENNLGNIGSVFHLQEDYPKAINYYLKALKIAEETGNKNGIALWLANIGSLYIKTGKFNQVEDYLFRALKINKEIGALNDERQIEEMLTTLYENTGKEKLALRHYRNAVILKDSIFSQENKKQLLRKELNFQFEKKTAVAKAEADKQAALAASEKKKQEIIIFAVVGVLILVLVFSLLLYKRFRLTNQQKRIIEAKEQVTQQQKHLIEEKHKEITDSINYAERIQRSFIATKEILDENLNDYFVLFKPKDIVSGDFYWAGKLSNGNFAFATADSTGHGVPGAIMSLLNITSLEKAIETLTKPSDILNATRKTIIERLKKDGSTEGGKDGMDASLTIYDFANNKLIIAAANNPVWIVRGNETIEIKADKMPVGKHDRQDISFTQQEIALQKGDVIYSLTDGFPDQFGGEKGKKFMSKNLRELLSANAHLPMQEQKQLLEETFSNWIGNLEQVDDVTLIGVRV